MLDIREILERWGAWVRSNPTQGIGALVMWDDGTGPGDMDKMGDDDAAVFDPCVCALKSYDFEAYEILLSKYVYRQTVRDTAEQRQIPKYVVCKKLEIGETFVGGFYTARLMPIKGFE